MNVCLDRVHAASYNANRIGGVIVTVLALSALSWFRVDQSLLFLLNAACLPEKQQISICIVFGMTRSGLEPTIYRTQGEHCNNYATDAVRIIRSFLDIKKNQ
jgi:hypothetical protein